MKMPQTATKLYITDTRELFHCHCKIKVPIEYGESLLDECFALMQEVNQKYNSYSEDSYFDCINQNAGKFVTVDDNTVVMLQILKLISELTLGAYDITAMPLIRLWGFYQNKDWQIPTKDKLISIKELVDYKKIEIDGNRVRIAQGQEIITGSFIKAFAVDQVVKFLKQRKVEDALINAGGSTIYGLNNYTHPQWFIRIPNPYDNQKSTERKAITNTCFSLSARAHNYLEINGKQYGHILNATTGYPAETLQVRVVSTSAFLSDALSSAIFALDKDSVEEITDKLKKNFEFDFERKD